MHAIASSPFHVIHFPRQGRIVTVDQIPFFSSSSLDGNVPYVKNISAPYDTTGFTPFHIVYGLEATPPIECEIPSLKLAFKLLLETSPQEEHLLYLERLDETRCLTTLVIEA